MDKSTISITAYGHPINGWDDWYQKAKAIFKTLGYEYNYLGSNIWVDGKIKTVTRSEKKLLNAIQAEDILDSVIMFSLPKDFKSASFDYDILIVRKREFTTLVVNKSDYCKLAEAEVTALFSNYVSNPCIEIYEMDRYEMPLLYASKGNPSSFFTTLKILKQL